VSLSLEKDLVEYRIAHGKDSPDGSRGAGIVYIVPCTHTLFFSAISALAAEFLSRLIMDKDSPLLRKKIEEKVL
jgi:hypothetical protein